MHFIKEEICFSVLVLFKFGFQRSIQNTRLEILGIGLVIKIKIEAWRVLIEFGHNNILDLREQDRLSRAPDPRYDLYHIRPYKRPDLIKYVIANYHASFPLRANCTKSYK